MKDNITKELIKAMISLQSEITPVHSDKQGQSGHRKFNYANLESLWMMLQPLLIKNNLWVTQEVVSVENEKESFDCVDTYLYHESGGVKYSRVRIRFSGSEIKQFGGSITYYRRYAQLALFNLVSSDDPEKCGDIYKDNEENQDSVVNEHQFQTLKDIFETLSKDNQIRAKDCMKQQYKVDSCKNLLAKHYDEFLRFLNALLHHQQEQFAAEVKNV